MVITKQRQFEVLRTVLAMAEERHDVPLAEAAAAVDLPVDDLRAILDPVLYLSYRTGLGELIDRVEDFYLSEDDVLVVTQQHWLRDLQGTPPPAEAALRLLVAGVSVQGLVTEPTYSLDRAVEKLRGVVGAHLEVGVPRPPCLPAVEQAWYEERSLVFRYRRDNDTDYTDREVLPHLVYCKWGHWYLQGMEVGTDLVKTFRVDRMHDAAPGREEFHRPADSEIPEWFDLAQHEERLLLRLTTAQLAAIPRPVRVEATLPLDDGRVEAEVIVSGARRCDYVLVCLDPEVEVVGPDEARVRQRAHATRLLAAYPA